jgi:ribosomal-protein-alanine N-acetyltransferase
MMLPELSTSRLVLTQIAPGDSADVLELFSSAAVIEHYDLPAFTALEQAEDLIRRLQARQEAGQGLRWAIRQRQSRRLIGTCGFNSWSPPMRSAVLGYDLNEKYWGQGLAFEALVAALRHAFSGALPCGPLNRIQADTIPSNARSASLLTRLGFADEGLRREAGYWKNCFHDLKCFGLLRRDFDRQFP